MEETVGLLTSLYKLVQCKLHRFIICPLYLILWPKLPILSFNSEPQRDSMQISKEKLEVCDICGHTFELEKLFSVKHKHFSTDNTGKAKETESDNEERTIFTMSNENSVNFNKIIANHQETSDTVTKRKIYSENKESQEKGDFIS